MVILTLIISAEKRLGIIIDNDLLMKRLTLIVKKKMEYVLS